MRSREKHPQGWRWIVAKAMIAVGVCALWPAHTMAQRALPRVGIPDLGPISPTSNHKFYERFEEALAKQGWVPGKNVIIEHRVFRETADSPLTDAVAEVIKLNVKVIFAANAPMLRASAAMTRTIPIVGNDMTTDPVAAGYAESYGRPGKNVTGVFLDAPEIGGKWVEILQSLIPRLSQVAVLWDPRPGAIHKIAVKEAASQRGVRIKIHEVQSKADIQRTFAKLRPRPQAIIILPSPLLVYYSQLLADLALEHKIPAISPFRLFVDSGGAIAYGPNLQNDRAQCRHGRKDSRRGETR